MVSMGELRECFATNFDQTPIGKRSSAGRLERKAPRERSQDCGGTRSMTEARFEILRGALDLFAREDGTRLAMSCELARGFKLCKRDASSGIDLATQVPAPVKVSR